MSHGIEREMTRDREWLTRITPVSWSTYCFSVSIRSLRGFAFLGLCSEVEGEVGELGVI